MAFGYQSAFVTLAVQEWEIMIDFYRQLLEQEPHPYLPKVYAEFQLIDLRLGIFFPQENHKQEFADSHRSGISLCIEVEDLSAAIEHLKTIGYPPPQEVITASHGQEIYAYDPQGNRLILHQAD